MSSSDNAEQRSNIFQLLALGFRHPDAQLHQLMVAGDYQSALVQSGLGTAPVPVVDDFSEFEAAYIRMFQMGSRGRPQVSLNAADHESMEGRENRPEFLLGYSSWYRHFGLKTTVGEGANELPDHIVCQLEFMCWLSHLEKSNPGDESYRLAQRDFIQRHLLLFLESLSSSLQAQEGGEVTSFYCDLALESLETVRELQAELEAELCEPVRVAIGHEDIKVVNLWE